MSSSNPLASHLFWLTAECIFYRRTEYYRVGASFVAMQQGCRPLCSTTSSAAMRNTLCAACRLLQACRESCVEITKSTCALHKLAVVHILQILLLLLLLFVSCVLLLVLSYIVCDCCWLAVCIVIVVLYMCFYLMCICCTFFFLVQTPDCWLEVSIRKVLRPATSTQVFLGFPVPKSKC